jgi:periplasmic protein CpxP/Spy
VTALTRSRVLVALLLIAGALTAGAQEPGPQGDPRRAALERRLREGMGKMVRERLELTDDQFAKMRASNQKFEESRRLLVQQERDVRMGLRDEMLAGPKANQQRVSDLLDRWQRVQRQRMELMESEQKELATFLTPVQRAKFVVLQEQLRRRVEDMRRQQMEGAGPPNAAGGNRPPGGRAARRPPPGPRP